MSEDSVHEQNRRPPEELEINSGAMLVVDQFMLGNPQFVGKLEFGPGFKKSVEEAALLFGGAVVPAGKGKYQVERDAQESLIHLQPEEKVLEDGDDGREVSRELFESVGRVFVDTRCVVFVDAGLINDKNLLDEYRKSRLENGEKQARDFLRSKGASVKYGFNRFGDELGIFHNSSTGSIALWPDVVEDIS